MSTSSFIPRQRVYLSVLVGMMINVTLLGTLCVSASHAISPSSFSIEPGFSGSYASAPRAYFTYNTLPGVHTHDSIHVTNASLVRGTVNLSVVDAITAQTSGTSVRPGNEPQVDVGAWITLSQQRVTLDPGKSQEVPFTLTVPLHVRPGQHGGIIIAEDTQQAHFTQSMQGSDTNIGIQSFIGLGVLVNLPGPISERLNATGISYDEQSTHQRLLLALANTGTQLLHPAGNLQVIDDQGQLLQNIPITMDTFLPQTAIDYPVYIQHKALALGRSYIAKLHLTYEHQHKLDYMTEFSIALPKKDLLPNLIQSLVTPPSGNNFSTLTPWHYIIGLSALFLLLSALFFWGQKIQRRINQMFRKK